MSKNDAILYDPSIQSSEPPEQQVLTVHRFLTRCRGWAEDRELPKYTRALHEGTRPDAAQKLEAWRTYVRFLNHTLEELETGTLDHWFRGDEADDM